MVILEAVEVIKRKVNITKLNDQCRKFAMLGMEYQDKPLNSCYECNDEVNLGKNLKCKFCKKKIHEECAVNDADINQALLQRESFTCTPCLAEVSPKMVTEDETFEKMLQLGNNISQLAAIEYQEPLSHHESGTDVELEEASDELPKVAINEGAGTSAQQSQDKSETIDLTKESAPAPGDCCVWNKCKMCDTLKSEKLVLETVHFEELKVMENKLDTVIKEMNTVKKENDDMKEEIGIHLNNIKEKTEVYETMRNKHEEELKIQRENNVNIDSITKELASVKHERDQMEDEIKSGKDSIMEKDNEIEKMKADHLKEVNEVKSLHTDNNDLNLKRLKKLYGDLKKEKVKIEDTTKKDVDSLKKHKAVLEAELLTASKENKNKDEERMTLLRIFDGMQEVLGKMNNMTTNPNNTVKEYACNICSFKSTDNEVLKTHRLSHHTDSEVNLACNICDRKCVDANSLTEHKRVHVKKHKCTHCLFKADCSDELEDHTRRRHSKVYECDWCDFETHIKSDISDHEKKDHNIQKARKIHSCQTCENVFRSASELQKHMEVEHGPEQSRSGFRKQFTYEEKRRNGFCRFWNHAACNFGDQNCKFMHEEAPHCKFQERCRAKPMCKYFHEEYSSTAKSSSFLGYPTLQSKGKGRNQNQRSF